jgi:hypothetical protein
MLIEEYCEQTKLYKCFDDRIAWVWATGLGKTPEIARYNYFSKSISAAKNDQWLNFNCAA